MESKIRDLRQEIFKFEQLSNFDKNDFFVSECNYFAFNLIKSWPNWEKKILNIYGERKSGKSHLSEIFLESNLLTGQDQCRTNTMQTLYSDRFQERRQRQIERRRLNGHHMT